MLMVFFAAFVVFFPIAAVVEFGPESGGGLAVVNSAWITPFKKEVHWPPYKDSKLFNRAVTKGEEISDNWKLYSITKCYYPTDDFEKAKSKLRLAEETSDLQTEAEEPKLTYKKRKLKRPLRFDHDDTDEDEEDYIARPPVIKLLKNIETTSNEPAERQEIADLTPSLASTPSLNRHCQLANESKPKNTVKSGFEIILTHILEIKQQNKRILNILEKQESVINQKLPDDVPVQFPIKTEENLNLLEEYLVSSENVKAIVKYWASLGGKDLVTKTNRILKEILDDSLAKNYNYYGRNQKKAFSELRLKSEIIWAVKQTSESTNREIEDAIKIWLKHAPERIKLAEKRGRTNN